MFIQISITLLLLVAWGALITTVSARASARAYNAGYFAGHAVANKNKTTL
jgi:hypothetical protein